MVRTKSIPFFTLVAALFVWAGIAHSEDIGGTVSSTVTIVNDSKLVSDVTCAVTGAPCIAFGASDITLNLNGFSLTGLGDAETGCGGMGSAGEIGIDANERQRIAIRGPGLVRQFRNQGIRLQNSNSVTISGVTISTNCFSGILVNGGTEHVLENNISVRNGNLVNPCGGI
jgi:hypothetical protein